MSTQKTSILSEKVPSKPKPDYFSSPSFKNTAFFVIWLGILAILTLLSNKNGQNSSKDLFQITINNNTETTAQTIQNSSISFYPRSKAEQLDRLNVFKANHEHIVRNLKPRKFAYVIPDTGGYGNKLIQVINAFTVALLTDSAVIINISYIGEYVEEPLYKTFQTTNIVTSINDLNYLHDPNTTHWLPKWTQVAWQETKIIKNMYTSLPEGYERFVFDGMCSLYFELACCNRTYFRKFLHYGLVRPETVDKAIAVLDTRQRLSNASNQDRDAEEENRQIDVLYRTGFEVANSIMNIFWRPASVLQLEVDKFAKEHFNGFRVIGMQFRVRDSFFSTWNDTAAFFECAELIETIWSSLPGSKPVKW
jgi:hypothetical protein